MYARKFFSTQKVNDFVMAPQKLFPFKKCEGNYVTVVQNSVVYYLCVGALISLEFQKLMDVQRGAHYSMCFLASLKILCHLKTLPLDKDFCSYISYNMANVSGANFLVLHVTLLCKIALQSATFCKSNATFEIAGLSRTL